MNLITSITDAILVESPAVFIVHGVTRRLGNHLITVKPIKQAVFRGAGTVTDTVTKKTVALDTMRVSRAVFIGLHTSCTFQVIKRTGVAVTVLLKFKEIMKVKVI